MCVCVRERERVRWQQHSDLQSEEVTEDFFAVAWRNGNGGDDANGNDDNNIEVGGVGDDDGGR